ncbi:MAG: putative glycoside hydrolase [Saccharofermentanales bacterium]
MKTTGSNMGNYPGTGRKQRRRRRNARRKLIFSGLILLLSAVVVVTVFFVFKQFLGGSNSDADSSSASGITSAESIDLAASGSSAEPSPTTAVVEDIFTLSSAPLIQVENPKVVQHNDLRALYIGAAANLDANIEIANNSDVNAFVVDMKESSGIYFAATNALAVEIGAGKSTFNIQTLVSKAKANNIKLIARIVCFKDHKLADARPDLCIKDKDGNNILYPREGNHAFVDPYKTEIWKYIVDIAKEAIALGFDEIQFDYVRFPVCNPTIRAAEYFGPEGTVPTKIECINRFLEYAKIEIQDKLGVPLSADIFGSVMVYKLDGELIGQEWASLGHIGLDALSPMIYPSHYADGTVMNGIKFANPDADTYKFLKAVYEQEKFSEEAGFSIQRPYIQGYDYTQAQVFGQIDALAEVGITEYIYWNATGKHNPLNIR